VPASPELGNLQSLANQCACPVLQPEGWTGYNPSLSTAGDEEERQPELRRAIDSPLDNQLAIQPDGDRLPSSFDTSAHEWPSVLPRQI